MKTTLESIQAEPCGKAELLRTCEEIYGVLPNKPRHLDSEIISEDRGFAAGKAVLKKQNLILELDEKSIKLEFTSVVPTYRTHCPAVIIIGQEKEIPNKFLPAEEIIDRGYAIFNFCFEDVATNDDNFKKGIAKHILESRRKRNASGKLAIWAWAAIRLTEYVSSLEYIDKSNIAIIGHALMAKAAMLAGALSDKCKYIIANEPGANQGGEGDGHIECKAHLYGHLFCPSYAENPKSNGYFPLLSLCFSKTLLIGNAIDDIFGDCSLELEALAITEGTSKPFDKKIIEEKYKIPDAPHQFKGESFSFHSRRGRSYLGREDWNIYLDFIDEKIGKMV